MQEILSNIKEAVKIAEMHNSKSSQVPKNKSYSKLDSPSDSVNNVNESKSKYSRSKNPCIYCKQTDHISALCQTAYTAAKRKLVISKIKDFQDCDLCMRHPKGSKQCHRRGKCWSDCDANEGEPDAKDLCKTNLDKVNQYNRKGENQTVETATIEYCPELVQENINGVAAKAHRAVALSTATFNCLNPEVMHLSPDKRVVGVLLDNAAQRTLVSHELVKRLCIKVLRKV